ncbi:tRNA dimethylallyltransferase isoform X1 [Culex quinquefasciatus]|uniref:tRNA dimethylallyltransferase isoform X1 n=1 Tax=Culex quinquefasciatus TaxID=7176 RepID=UPI0018E3BC39|nr:tRNA dimethylallyltransferase isoform X1 [Culex quinquefasciatus]
MLRLPRGLAASVFRAVFSRACSVVAMATGGESAGVSASDRRKNEGPPPLVVILGSTGVGKTKLSIELARRFDGEIISADSMQVYRGLDIVTAKATREEQAQARHHLLDVATPDQAFTVIHFREAALPIIDRLLEQNRMPIVVGGTNYYIESVLWQVLVGTGIHEERTRRRTTSSSSSQEEDAKRPKLSSTLEESESGGNRESAKEDDAKKVVGSENESGEQVEKIAASGDDADEEESELVARVLPMATEQLEQLESPVLHRVLRRVDPVSADRLHPNNKRKIVRALEVLRQDGQPLSRILAEQRGQAGGSRLGGPLRYRNVVIFWLRCEQETLNARLNSRVDSMVAQGLLAEIRQFYERFVKPYDDNDFHRGILQSIGFKEFVRYLEKYDRDHDRLIEEAMATTGEGVANPPEGLPLLRSCLDNLKLVTQRYSKKQLKWINHRFLVDGPREVPPIYALDTTDVSRWDEIVSGPAVRLIEAHLAGTNESNLSTILAPLPKHASPRAGLNEETSFHCDICQRTIVGEYQWADHLKSNRHKKCLQSKHKKEKNQHLTSESISSRPSSNRYSNVTFKHL